MGRKAVGAPKIDENWERALALEPRLAELEREILALPDPLPDDLDMAAVWSGWEDRIGIKPRLTGLVGWGRGGWSLESLAAGLKSCRTSEERRALLTSGVNLPAFSSDEEWMHSSEAYEATAFHLSDLIPLHAEAVAS